MIRRRTFQMRGKFKRTVVVDSCTNHKDDRPLRGPVASWKRFPSPIVVFCISSPLGKTVGWVVMRRVPSHTAVPRQALPCFFVSSSTHSEVLSVVIFCSNLQTYLKLESTQRLCNAKKCAIRCRSEVKMNTCAPAGIWTRDLLNIMRNAPVIPSALLSRWQVRSKWSYHEWI